MASGKRLSIHLVIIDPQNDFSIADDGKGNKGSLVVPGADKDMDRLAALVDRAGARFDDIHVTLDSHQTVGIERGKWFKRVGDGAPPPPFTRLGIHPDGRRIVVYTLDGKATEEEYTTTIPSMLHQGGPTGKGTFGYLEALATANRYPHMIWPVHCVVGSWGHNVVPTLHRSLCKWEAENFSKVNYITKGNNPFTEHFSAVRAEVPDPSDPSTQVNTRFIQTLEEADIIVLTGEALSHCIANTCTDVANSFSDPRYAEKITILTDCMSNVSGCEAMGNKFLADMKARGAKLSTSTDFLA